MDKKKIPPQLEKLLEPKEKREQRRRDRHRQKLCTLRKQAKISMKTLGQNLQEIKRLRKDESKTPEDDYALIFKDEETYFQMLSACNSAYRESYLSKLKLFSPETIDNIQFAVITANIKPLSRRYLANPRNRNKVIVKLKRKKTPSGGNYLEVMQSMALDHKRQLEFENECNLGSSLFKIGYKPQKLNNKNLRVFFGESVFPSKNLALRLNWERTAGKVCVGWQLCKKIREAISLTLNDYDDSVSLRK